MFDAGEYRQDQLPSELFNNVGRTSYGGMEYNVENTGHGTRKITPVGGGNTGSNGSLQAPDIAKLRDQVYETLKPYYLQLAKESQGDFNRAVSQMQEDYTKGVRDTKINFAQTQRQQTQDLQNSLAQLGIGNLQEQDKTIDDLNKRGMAVYQNNPDGTPNALRTSPITSNTDFNVQPGGQYNDTSTIDNSADANMGRGGYELSQLQQQQRLRQEAQQRAATRPIEESGIKLKQYTNLPAGINPNLPPDQLAKALAASGVDRSQLGSAEQDLVRGNEQRTRELQQNQEDLANQRSQDTSQIAGGLASTGNKALGEQLQNQLQKERQNTFVSTGS